MATYSVRADGTAANKGAATGQNPTTPSACMNVDVFNGESFSAGDSIYIYSNGGVYYDQFTIPSGGTNGSLINYIFDADVLINGADLTSDWSQATNESSLAASTTDAASMGIHKFTTSNYEGGNEWAATGNVDISTVTIYGRKSGTPTGSVWLQIYDESGGEPDSPVTNGKSQEIDVSEFGTSNSVVSFVFSTPPSLSNGATYFFIVESDMTVDGSNFLYVNYGGTAPINGLTRWTVTEAGSWTEESDVLIMEIFQTGSPYSNVWRVGSYLEVMDLHYDGTQGTEESSIGNIDAAGEWIWDTGILYFYSTSDPDTVYTNPGVEASIRDYCIYCDKSFVNLNGNLAELRYTVSNAIRLYSATRITGAIVQQFTVHDIMYNVASVIGVEIINAEYTTIKKIEAYYVSWNAIQLTIWAYSQPSYNGNIIEECYVHDNTHNGLDIHNISPARSPMAYVIIRNNKAHNNLNGIYFVNEDSNGEDISRVYCYGNVSYTNQRQGISLDKTGTGAFFDSCQIYNNTCTGNGTDYEGGGMALLCTNSLIKNNICANNQAGSYNTYEIACNDGGGTSNTMDYNLVWHPSNSNIYYWDLSLYTAATIYPSTGQQQNAVHSDPQFWDSSNDRYWLNNNSPAKEVGVIL